MVTQSAWSAPTRYAQRSPSRLHTAQHQPPGIARHTELVAILLRAGELVQGLADLELAAMGADDIPHRARPASASSSTLPGSSPVRRQGFAGPVVVPARVRKVLADSQAPLSLSIREPEGMPSMLFTRRAIRGRAVPGLLPTRCDRCAASDHALGDCRASIGAAPPIHTAAVGDPSEGGLQSRRNLRKLCATGGGFRIVTKDPAFPAARSDASRIGWRITASAPTRIHFFPGHKGGLGPQSCGRHRERWAERPRHVIDVDDLLIKPSHSAATSPIGSPISSARSRSRSKTSQPAYGARSFPAIAGLRRRQVRNAGKFLAHTAGGPWLVKFAGLGEAGQRKLVKARLLAEGRLHATGRRIMPWLSGSEMGSAKPMAPPEFRRPAFIAHLGRYLSFRAHSLPPPAAQGASMAKLCEMAVINTEEALGRAAASRLKSRLGDAERYDSTIVPVDTDNRLHRWEWLVAGERHILKTDAFDHSSAHDLVGCQDIGWDIAGASIEFDLTGEERAALRAAVSEGCSRIPDAGLLELFELSYLAFQLGMWMSAKAGGHPRLKSPAGGRSARLCKVPSAPDRG